MQREAERRRREAERAARALEKERQRQAKEAARQRVYDEKEQKRLYAEQRAYEAEQLTREIADRVEQLEGLLKASLSTEPSLDIEALKEQLATIPFDPGELATPIDPPVKTLPAAPSILGKLLPGAKMTARSFALALTGATSRLTARHSRHTPRPRNRPSPRLPSVTAR
jgi:hypothetical protein